MSRRSCFGCGEEREDTSPIQIYSDSKNVNKKRGARSKAADEAFERPEYDFILFSEFRDFTFEVLKQLDNQAKALKQLCRKYNIAVSHHEREYICACCASQSVGINTKQNEDKLAYAEVICNNIKKKGSKTTHKNLNKKEARKPALISEVAGDLRVSNQTTTTTTSLIPSASQTVLNGRNPEILRGRNVESLEIRATQRKKHLHIWRLSLDTTEEKLTSYIKGICGIEVDVKVIKIKSKKVKEYASFIVTVSESVYEKLYSPEVWPVNTECCQWFWFRKPKNKTEETVKRLKPSRYSNYRKYCYPEWYTKEIISDLQLKAKLHKKYKCTNSPNDYRDFSACSARIKLNIKLAFECYEERIQNNLVNDPKSFWLYIRARNSNSAHQNSILKNGEVLSDADCAAEFAAYFYSVFSRETARLNVEEAMAAGTGSGSYVHVPELTSAQVRDALVRLKPKRSAGPDGIPAYIMRDCRSILAEPLAYLFNLCLDNGYFPDCWKITRVIPIPKSERKDSVEAYRPVAILSTPAKIFEGALHKNILKQVEPYLSDCQRGFRPLRSTSSNLLNAINYVIPIMDAGLQITIPVFSVLSDCDAREWSLVSDERMTLAVHVFESIQGCNILFL
ncbi:unnamed protein product [Pieris macdunnoughi]|uniref:Reverse transcriptase domain-containing protein n=1 Tax=Pieris macdunnoughi TaxID=345717 RepID=A0A821NK71_9NEOP|nr:unnamed protein product [Pieris macdunnoughi]